MRFRLRLITLAALSSLAFGSAAPAQEMPFDAYLQQVAAKARAQGVSQGAINTVLAGMQPNTRVIELDRDNVSSGGSSSGFPPMAPYIARHNSDARISAGRRVYRQILPIAAEVERRYGVPPQIILAIWGHETSYGAV